MIIITGLININQAYRAQNERLTPDSLVSVILRYI